MQSEFLLPVLLCDISEVIKRLLIRGGGLPSHSPRIYRSNPRVTVSKSSGPSTSRDASFWVVSDFQPPSGYPSKLPTVICVTFGRRGRTVSVNWILAVAELICLVMSCTPWIKKKKKTALIFAKARVAPVKDRTLPTLELMVVFLALKCLGNLS